jgi:hypothetical protein
MTTTWLQFPGAESPVVAVLADNVSISAELAESPIELA